MLGTRYWISTIIIALGLVRGLGLVLGLGLVQDLARLTKRSRLITGSWHSTRSRLKKCTGSRLST